MSDSSLGTGKTIIDARDNSGGLPVSLGDRWRSGGKGYMLALIGSVTMPAYGVVKLSGSTGYTVIPCAATSDLIVGVFTGSASLTSGVTTVVQTQGAATVFLLTNVQSQAIDIGLVPTATAGACNTISQVATTALPQKSFGHLLVSVVSTAGGSSGTAFIDCLGAA